MQIKNLKKSCWIIDWEKPWKKPSMMKNSTLKQQKQSVASKSESFLQKPVFERFKQNTRAL